MNPLPIMLNLDGRCVLVVGAGKVGLRKAGELAGLGARVRLVSPPGPAGAIPPGIEHVPRAYRSEDLDGATLVFVCTDDAALNGRIAADARARGAWVNVVDVPELCDFYMPAIVRRGPVTVAVGTGGTSPALARTLKCRLADALPEDTAAFAQAVGRLRRRILGEMPDTPRRRELLLRLASEEAWRQFTAAGPGALEALAAEGDV